MLIYISVKVGPPVRKLDGGRTHTEIEAHTHTHTVF
jgi:hypothetical protein